MTSTVRRDSFPALASLLALITAALLLALAFRSWLLTDDDEVQDDVGDRAVGRTDLVHEEVADAFHEMIPHFPIGSSRRTRGSA